MSKNLWFYQLSDQVQPAQTLTVGYFVCPGQTDRHVIFLTFLPCLCLPPSPNRPEPHSRGGGSQPSQADSPLPEQDEEILGSDDDEQEDPNDYCKGVASLRSAALSEISPLAVTVTV